MSEQSVETTARVSESTASWRRIAGMREFGLMLIILVLCIAMSFASPYFLTWANIRAMLMSFSVEGIVVVGMTVLLIVGAIDLSVGSVVCFAMVVSGYFFLAGVDPWIASLMGIGAILGMALRSVVSSSLILLNVSVCWQDAIRDLILLAAVAIDHLLHNRKSARSSRSIQD